MEPDAVVHLIDDDDAVGQALCFQIATSGFAVRVYDSAVAFLAALPTLQPGCILTDIRMPEIDGLELQRQLKTREVRLPVVVMTGHGDVPLAVQAMKAGAVDFIEKPFSDETLLAAIRSALEKYRHDAQRQEELASMQARFAALSPRERMVLDGLVAGQPNKAIANGLHISARTVEVHRANLMAKMGAASLSDLVRMFFIAKSD